MRNEAIRILKQLIGCAVVIGLVVLFWWWRHGNIFASPEFPLEAEVEYVPTPIQK